MPSSSSPVEWVESYLAALNVRAVPIAVKQRYRCERLTWLIDSRDIMWLLVEHHLVERPRRAPE
ncbi:hypothetical protein ABZY68_20690 [Streptomyces sp. NPDC006482]|uniref:hypothetical protein n=1 Tax=Streptomyces sp. NPDC006482 TaxID=3154306 RepID=UPI0033B1ABAF